MQRFAWFVALVAIVALTLSTSSACVLLGLENVPCSTDADCPARQTCTPQGCEGEGEGEAGEGEGEEGEGEEGEGEEGEGEEGEGEEGEGEEGEGEPEPADFTVDTTLDSDDDIAADGACRDAAGRCSLRAAFSEAIAAAPVRKVIHLDANVTLTGSINLLPEEVPDGVSIAIYGFGFIVTASGEDSVFDLRTGHVELFNIEMTNGANVEGGAIRVETPGSLDARNLTVHDCTADESFGGAPAGGALSINGAVVTIVDSHFENNRVITDGAEAGGGGAIAARSGADLTVQRTTFVDNTANNAGGGAILLRGSTTTAIIETSTFESNAAADDGTPAEPIANGGAIAIGEGAGLATIVECTFTSNSAAAGGAISLRDATLDEPTIERNLFELNAADVQGGAMDAACSTTGALAIVNSTFFNNRGGTYGDAVRFCGDTLTIASSTLVSDAGTAHVAADASDVFFDHVIVKGAELIAGSATCRAQAHNFLATDFGLCLVDGTDITSNTDPLLDDLNDNGGPTRTMALLPASSAINRGGSCPDEDQRGYLRADGDPCDAGAYEVDAEEP